MSTTISFHSVARFSRHKVGRKLVIGRYRVAESVERVAQRFTDPDNLAKSITDTSLFSEDFTAYADGVRVVNDLSKNQHINMLRGLLGSGALALSDAYHAIGPDNSVFVLFHGMSSECPLSIIGRFSVNQDGQISRLWSRRGVAAPEAEKLLKDPEAPAARLAALPRLRIKPAPPDERRQANMLATMDSYIEAMNTWSDTERQAHVDSFTLEDFQKWEGTGVWGALSDAVRCTSYACESDQWERGLVADRKGFSKAMGILNRSFGAENSPGRMRSIVRAKAASATHNLGFMHFDTIGLAEHGPIAFDVMVVFVFTQDGLQIKQAAAYRSSACIQEYATVFKMSTDVSGAAGASS